MKQKIKNVWSSVKEHPFWIISVVAITAFGFGFGAGKYYYEIEINKLKSEISKLQKRTEEIGATSLHKKEAITVLEPTWVFEDLPIQALSGELLIKVSDVNGFNKIATFDIYLPDKKIINWKDVALYDRNTFTFKNVRYIFDVLDIGYVEEKGKRGAKVSIIKSQ